MVPEWSCSSGFMRKLSRRANAPSMWYFNLLNSFGNLFVSFPHFFQKRELCSLPVIWEHSSFVPSCSRMFLTVFLIACCQFSFVRVVFFYGKSNDHSVILEIFCRRTINFGISTVLINTAKGITNTGYYLQYSKNNKKLVSSVLSFLLFIPFGFWIRFFQHYWTCRAPPLYVSAVQKTKNDKRSMKN